MTQKDVVLELESFRNYLRSADNEDAKRPLLYPLFKKLFTDKFVIESNAHGADIYIAGGLLVESKTSYDQWVEGFYQALHYQKKFGMAYNTIMVVAHRFIAIWKVNHLPEHAVLFHHTASSEKAPNVVGKENAKRTALSLRKEIRDSAFYWLDPNDLTGDIFAGAKNITTESYEILKILRNLDSDRLQVNTHNFIQTIERMKPMFAKPIDAVHCFYTIVAYWDITSTVTEKPNGKISVTGFKGKKGSEDIEIAPRRIPDFKKFIETQYVFTNEGSGLTVDYYFSRFDEVLARIDPEYVKQHGIFFTNDNLSKFALWMVKESFADRLEENYIVLDPAGGSGNLISSWRGKLKHKIISELQPDLLRIIERRMQVDPWHIEKGFSIIPKTSENKGLNFLDCTAEHYLAELKKELKLKNIELDKPLAFLLNPPYKNTDENVRARVGVGSEYEIDPSILQVTGQDAGKERYLAFLGQILNISKIQAEEHTDLHPVVMIFTPTSWLIPRPTYVNFRKQWDQHFKFHSGFIVTSNTWFKLDGKWPLAFTIWTYDQNEQGNLNQIILKDLTSLEKSSINFNWNVDNDVISNQLNLILDNSKDVLFNCNKGCIKDILPSISLSGLQRPQQRLNFYRHILREEKEAKFKSGFPSLDPRHNSLAVPYGYADGNYVGFMDNLTPVRLKQEPAKRHTIFPDRIWFQLRPTFIDVNLTKVLSGAPDKYGYVAHDLPSALLTSSWFCITKVVNGIYPIWANQYDIWPPRITPELEQIYYGLCFAYVLAENRCVVTKFEQDNPVEGAPEVFVNNPLCPTNAESFWCTTLQPYMEELRINENGTGKEVALLLVDIITEFYKYWNMAYCKGQVIEYVGLQDEPYFKFFDYPDFLTPHSGLIQIRQYATIHGKEDLLSRFKEISAITKQAREEIFRLLTVEFGYFA